MWLGFYSDLPETQRLGPAGYLSVVCRRCLLVAMVTGAPADVCLLPAELDRAGRARHRGSPLHHGVLRDVLGAHHAAGALGGAARLTRTV